MSKRMVSRFSFDVTPNQVASLDRLIHEAHVKSQHELFGCAFYLLAWAVQQSALGRTIAAIDEKASVASRMSMGVLNKLRSGRKNANHRQ